VCCAYSTERAAVMRFSEVVAGYYNAVAAGLGLEGAGLQLYQPSPILPVDDKDLWGYLDAAPLEALFAPGHHASTERFSSAYRDLVSSLVVPNRSRFVDAVGRTIADEFTGYVSLISPVPRPSRLPSFFRNWALMHHPTVANAGATAMSAMLLEPLGAAVLALLPYDGDAQANPPVPSRLPDWNQGYAELRHLLSAAPGREFKFSDSSAATDVSGGWSHGVLGTIHGLLVDSDPSSAQSVKFASSEFSVSAFFGHLVRFGPIPGPWYSSAALGIAYDHEAGPPWNPASAIDWNLMFGPTGRLRLVAVSLIVADAVEILVKSSGPYDVGDQSDIQDGLAKGIWPLYIASGIAEASVACEFDKDGSMSLSMASDGAPVLLGSLVMPAERFLGH